MKKSNQHSTTTITTNNNMKKKQQSFADTIAGINPQNNDEIIRSIADQLINNVKDGNESAVKTIAKIRFMQLIFEHVETHIHEDVLHELNHAPENDGVEIYGFRVKRKIAGGRFNYVATGHPVYQRIIETIEPLNERKKEIESLLQKMKTSMTIVDEETGLTCTVTPPLKENEKTTFQVTRK